MSVKHKNSQSADNAHPALVPASFHDSDEEYTESHIPFDIHQYFGLTPGTPICLDSLQDPDPGQKPTYTYATLVKLAIWSSPHRRLTLSGVYQALEDRFTWFRECDNPNAWKTSIRHSLSLMAVFVKLPMDIHLPGKGHYWTVDFTKGDGYKRPRKRGKKSQKGVPDASSSVLDIVSTAAASPSSSLADFERKSRAYSPYEKAVAQATVKPMPQFRHYRMCTYLCPEFEGERNPDTVLRVPDIEQGANRDVQAKRSRECRHPVQIATDPIMSTSLRETGGSTKYLSAFQSTDDGDEEYFHPSAASYQAYRVASEASPDIYTWEAKSRTISGAAKTRTHIKDGTMMRSQDNELEEEEEKVEREDRSSKSLASTREPIRKIVVSSSPFVTPSHSASPDSDIEEDE
ncbi:hypothetical protein EW145_g1641 [Phellinidium pouzarii]|uniref:Fork-head domain-containing protein n=1 Tax=Phellinidium pouzarii TaxID=167371 RepID=A0A4S4LDR1_9AGAM|nr:hypothetical protein EW145_g1641 [Phellinidium pouzarii]